MSVQKILEKAEQGGKLTTQEGLSLYQESSLANLGKVAHRLRQKRSHPETVTYLVDRNINYTNVCVTNCKFCAFYRPPDHPETYVLNREQLKQKILETLEIGGTRILMQGGHHPTLKLSWYTDLLKWLTQEFPSISLDCFSPSEIDNLCQLEDRDSHYILSELQDAGLKTLPGGGAEILDDEVRSQVSPKKISGLRWIEIMRSAQEIGLNTTASMVIGFGEEYSHRLRHLDLLRNLQRDSLERYGKGFQAFISWTLQFELTPLSRQMTRNKNRGGGVSDYLRNLAISRIYLNNFDHFQASWPTMGFDIAQVALGFGADDFGSTMLEENVVSQASTETKTKAYIQDIQSHITDAGFRYQQRNTNYEWVGKNTL
jgi:cyclic dehypoxanthinyl futalosine synthase